MLWLKSSQRCRFTDGTPAIDFPCLGGTVGPDVIDIRPLYNKTRKFTYDPGFMSTASCRSNDHLHRRRRRHPDVSRLSDRAARARHCDFLEVAYLILNGELPNQAAARRVRIPSSRITRWCTSNSSRFYSRFPPRRAPDGGAVRRGRRVVRVLSRLAQYQRSTASRDLRVQADCQTADDHGDGYKYNRVSRSCIRRTRCPTSRIFCT